MKRILLSTLVTLLWMSAAVPGWADDTDIYGANSINVKPNILIVFDTSGSMGTADVRGEYYDPATTYTGSYTSTAVYRKTTDWWGRTTYTLFANSIANIPCPNVVTDLQTDGYAGDARIYKDWWGQIRCNGGPTTLCTGNYINYETSVGAYRTRIEVAQEVIANLINTTDNVRFGLMKFNNGDGSVPQSRGSVLVHDLVDNEGANRTALVTAVNALTVRGYTPLAESLAEAGLYYAGQTSWYHSGVYTTSPMQYKCQKNYIIFMTDGEPTSDDDARLDQTGAYINGGTIGDLDGDSSDRMNRLPDVAKFLYDNDINTSMGTTGEQFQKQNVITFTIGFQTEQELLMKAADNGGGEYFTANSISGLANAFENILRTIQDINAVFVAPVVPVSRMSRTYSGESVYLGFFKPTNSGRWEGNIKKYGLRGDGAILDETGAVATMSDGTIKDNARSYWSIEADGPNVTKGGLGSTLLNQGTRNLYTYLGTTTSLANASNAFAIANSALTAAMLGVSTATERDTVINDVLGSGRTWIMGDVLHSEPMVVHYGSESYIFVGTNGGTLHCFRDSDGFEEWSFIPPEQLINLKKLSDSNVAHDYFVDGAPRVHTDSATGQKILIFGQRRGSTSYHAIDVTNPTAPVYLYAINANILGANAEQLGQAWGRPLIGTIATSPGVTEKVALLPGGYDTNQDLTTPSSTDSKGRAVFAVRLSNGTLTSLNSNHANASVLTHCIVDLTAGDTNSDDIINRMYAADLGGHLYAAEDDNQDGTWNGRKLFDASADGTQRKVFNAPSVAIINIPTDPTGAKKGEMVFFGTGDRENPTSTSVENRFYAVKNYWDDPAPTSPMTESDLYEATGCKLMFGTDAEKEASRQELDYKRGWFLRLTHTGEKMISTPVVFEGVVYFTTYTPESGSVVVTDPCDTIGGRGQGRIYAVDAKTGNPVMNLSDPVNPQGAPDSPDDITTPPTSSMPSAPTVVITEQGSFILTGEENRIRKSDVALKPDMHKFYWRELNN